MSDSTDPVAAYNAVRDAALQAERDVQAQIDFLRGEAGKLPRGDQQRDEMWKAYLNLRGNWRCVMPTGVSLPNGPFELGATSGARPLDFSRLPNKQELVQAMRNGHLTAKAAFAARNDVPELLRIGLEPLPYWPY